MDGSIIQSDGQQATHKKDKVYWHDGFYAALQLEFHDYRDALTFEDEHQLSKEALIMDVLIIKKTANVRINKNIGRIFKNRNVFEYKSESDSLTIWDYHKVVGYAMIYSAFEEISIDEITISFVVTQKPIKLFDYLTNGRGFQVNEVSPGIYYVIGDTFATQIIESKKLNAKENVFIKNLRSNLTKKDLQEVLDAFRDQKPPDKVNAYLNRVMNANKLTVEEVLSMDEETIDLIIGCLNRSDLFQRKLEENGILARVRAVGEEKKARDTALEMLKDGFTPEKIAHYVKMPLEWVLNLTR